MELQESIGNEPTVVTANAQGEPAAIFPSSGADEICADNVTILLPATFGGMIEIECPLKRGPKFLSGLSEKAAIQSRTDSALVQHGKWLVMGERKDDCVSIRTQRGRAVIGFAAHDTPPPPPLLSSFSRRSAAKKVSGFFKRFNSED
jgi:hypothetical protein